MRTPQSDVEGHHCDRQDNPPLIAQPQNHLEHGCRSHHLSCDVVDEQERQKGKGDTQEAAVIALAQEFRNRVGTKAVAGLS